MSNVRAEVEHHLRMFRQDLRDAGSDNTDELWAAMADRLIKIIDRRVAAGLQEAGEKGNHEHPRD